MVDRDTGRWTLCCGRFARRSALNTQHSALSTRHSALGASRGRVQGRSELQAAAGRRAQEMGRLWNRRMEQMEKGEMNSVRFFGPVDARGPWLVARGRSVVALLALFGELMSRSKGQLGKWGSLSTSGFLCFQVPSRRPVKAQQVHGRVLGPVPIQVGPSRLAPFSNGPLDHPTRTHAGRWRPSGQWPAASGSKPGWS